MASSQRSLMLAPTAGIGLLRTSGGALLIPSCTHVAVVVGDNSRPTRSSSDRCLPFFFHRSARLRAATNTSRLVAGGVRFELLRRADMSLSCPFHHYCGVLHHHCIHLQSPVFFCSPTSCTATSYLSPSSPHPRTHSWSVWSFLFFVTWNVANHLPLLPYAW